MLNNKQYVGDHSSTRLNDSYLGSGKILREAIKKYGKINFVREILEIFDTKESAFNAQEKYIIKYSTLSPDGYNLSPKGGNCVIGCCSPETTIKKKQFRHSQESKDKIAEKHRGVKQSPEHIRNRIKSGEEHHMHGKFGELNPLYKRKRDPNVVKRINDANTGKTRTDEWKIQHSESLKGKERKETKTCQYCGKSMAFLTFGRWHGEKCKSKNIDPNSHQCPD